MFKREVSPFPWTKKRGKNNLIYCVVWAWSSPVIASSWPRGSGLMAPVVSHSCHAPARDGLKESRDKFDRVMLLFPSVWMASALLFSLNTNAQRLDTNRPRTRSSPEVPSTLDTLWLLFCDFVILWFCDYSKGENTFPSCFQRFAVSIQLTRPMEVDFPGGNVDMSICLPDFTFPRRLIRASSSKSRSAQSCPQCQSGWAQNKKQSPKPSLVARLSMWLLPQNAFESFPPGASGQSDLGWTVNPSRQRGKNIL